jgi:hypothetical protein
MKMSISQRMQSFKLPIWADTSVLHELRIPLVVEFLDFHDSK